MAWLIILSPVFIGIVLGLKDGIIIFKQVINDVMQAQRENEAFERKRLEKLERKRQADINEYLRQLKSIQYQLSLLNKLDDFRSSELTDEKAVKKALSLEKQYHVLCQKERKLKRDLEKLGFNS